MVGGAEAAAEKTAGEAQEVAEKTEDFFWQDPAKRDPEQAFKVVRSIVILLEKKLK